MPESGKRPCPLMMPQGKRTVQWRVLPESVLGTHLFGASNLAFEELLQVGAPSSTRGAVRLTPEDVGGKTMKQVVLGDGAASSLESRLPAGVGKGRRSRRNSNCPMRRSRVYVRTPPFALGAPVGNLRLRLCAKVGGGGGSRSAPILEFARDLEQLMR